LSTSSRRAKLLLAAFLLAWVGLLVRVAYLQLWNWRHFQHEARRQHWERLDLSPRRGLLFDRQGRALVCNKTTCAVQVLPQYVRDSTAIRDRKDALAELLAGFGLGTEKSIRRELGRRNRLFRLRCGVDREIGDSLRQVLVRHGFHNCTFVDDEHRRVYPFEEECATVLGLVGTEGKGMAGIEQRFDSTLRGIPGSVLLQRDAIGNQLSDPSYPRKEPLPGADIHLTLDVDIQHICYQALKRVVDRSGALDGSAIVLDAGTGAVLALADYPSYDPMNVRRGDTTYFNAAGVCDVFEPGSSFKPVLAVAALESDKANYFLRRTYDVSAGYIEVSGHKINDVHSNGVLDFPGLFIKSSNPGCALLSLELDRELFYQKTRALGFGSGVGLGLTGERCGSIDNPAGMRRLRFANNAFGQGLTVTLFELASAYLCIANRGAYIKPYIIDRVVDRGRVVCDNKRTRVRQVMRPATAEFVKDILQRVVSEGTGVLAAIPGLTACGKTGTAQKVEPTGGYSDTKALMTFVGFFPKHEPRYVVAVMVDEPKIERYASTTACPAFAEIGSGIVALERMRQRLDVVGVPDGIELAGATE